MYIRNHDLVSSTVWSNFLFEFLQSEKHSQTISYNAVVKRKFLREGFYMEGAPL